MSEMIPLKIYYLPRKKLSQGKGMDLLKIPVLASGETEIPTLVSWQHTT